MALTTTDFLGLSETSAQTQGLPDARIVSVAHPIGTQSEDELRLRAAHATDESIALLTGSTHRNTTARRRVSKE